MFLLSDLAVTTSENKGLALTITPEASLEADFVIRYFITGAGLHPASSGSFLYASGAFEFARGTTAALTTTIGRTVNNLVKDYPKGLSVKIASYEVNEVGGVRTESNENVLLDDHRVTITDSSDTTAKATHDVPFTSNRDVENLGNSFDSRDISQGAGDDLLIITRHMTRSHDLNDTDGQNIIKFDYGVVITSISQSVSTLLNGERRINESRIQFDSGLSLKTKLPAGNLFQIGDNALLSYDDFYNEIRKDGTLSSGSTILNRAYKVTEHQVSYVPFQTATGAFSVSGLTDQVQEGQTLSFTLAPSATLSSLTTISWQITGVGRVPLSKSDITTTKGVLTFAANATSTDSQSVTIPINDNQLIDYERQFLLKIEATDSSGVSESLVENYVVTITDNEMASEGELFQLSTIYDDVILLGNDNRKEEITGSEGDDIYVVTRHLVSDVRLSDVSGDNIIKFDEGVVITKVDEDKIQFTADFVIYNKLSLTVETGAELTISTPVIYDYQIGDGLVMGYEDFISALTSGGFTTDAQSQPTTSLATPYPVTQTTASTGVSLSHSNITIIEGRQTIYKDLATIKSTLSGYGVSVSDSRFEAARSGSDHILRIKANSVFDYEAGADVLVPIRFHKSGEADVTATFTVHLLDKNEAPTATGFATSYQLTEDGTTSKTATETPVISDPDAGDTLDTLIIRAIYTPAGGFITEQIVALGQDYTLPLSYGTLHISRASEGGFSWYYQLDNGAAAVNGLTGTQTVTESLSFSLGDDENLGAPTSQLTITIQGHNDAPVLTKQLRAISLKEGHYAEATDTAFSFLVSDPDGTPTVTLSGDDRFQLTSDYKVQIKAGSSFDYETVADRSFTLTITATDNLDTTLTDTQTIVVAFADLNEAPTIDSGVGFINIEADTAISYDIPATAFADQDDNDALTYTVSLNGGGALPTWLSFANNTLSGTPTSTDVGRYVLDITATDKAGLSVIDKLVIAPKLTATELDNNSFYLGTAHSTHSGGRLVGNVTVSQLEDVTASLTGADASFFTVTSTNKDISITYKDGVTDDSRLIGTAYDVQLLLVDNDSASRKLTLNTLNIIQGKEIIATTQLSRNFLTGTSGDDVAVAPDNGLQSNILTFGGDDLIYGSNNGDIIRSGTGDDIIYAKGGKDLVYLSSGANIVDGGADNDILDFGAATSGVTFDLSGETDSEGFFRATGTGLEGTRFKNFESIYATNYDDVIKGDDNANTINARGGNDTIHAYGGDDVIDADGGNTIYAGDGNDDISIKAGSENDSNVIYGGQGNDNLQALNGNDYLYGGEGKDILTGSGGDDFLYGNVGDDRLAGDSGNDVLDGGAGADEIRGGTGFDRLTYANSSQAVSVVLAIVQIDGAPTVYTSVGSTGGDAEGDKIADIEEIIGSDHDDIFYAGNTAENFDGGKGVNTVSYAYSTTVELITIDLSASTDEDGYVKGATGAFAQGDKFKNIQNLTGSNVSASVFVGNDQNNILTAPSHLGSNLKGGAGNDTLIGGEDFYIDSSGRKTQRVQLGKDVLDGGAGQDVIHAKGGRDVIYGSAGGDVIDGGAGLDTLTYVNSNAGITMDFTTATYHDDGYISGFTGGYAAGDKFKNIEFLKGSSHNDTITYRHQDDSKLPGLIGFYLLGGDDIFTGSDVREEVFSGTGDDTIRTHGGNDTVNIEGGDNLVYLGDGIDEVIVQDEKSSTDDVLTAYGEAGDDTLRGGNKTIDKLYGGAGNDSLHGLKNNDVLHGGDGDDRIFNDGGDDVVDGGAGTDTIHLGSGKDIITGGTGTDIFTMGKNIGLAESQGTDIFTDFEQGEKIKLDLPNFSDDNKFTGTTIDDVLNAFKMTGQTNTWRISQANTANDSGKNDPTKLDTLVHYSFLGSSEYYIRFVFEDLDFDLTASHFEIV